MTDLNQLDIHQAKAMVDEGKATLVDIRDPFEFGNGHVEGAVHLGDHNVTSFVSDTPKDTPLIVCCYHGISSQNAAMYLIEQGFGEVYSMAGGMEAWKATYPFVQS